MEREENFEEALASKLNEMESPSYVPPPRFCRRDYIATAAAAAVCLAAVLLGAAL